MAGLRRVAAVVGVAMLLALPAEGQRPGNPLRMLALTSDDLRLLAGTAQRLYDAGETGAAEDWFNDGSGNSGTVRLLRIFERDGLPCRRVEHVLKIKGDASRKRLVLQSCRDSDGVWKMI